jgi:hypothetical protein
MSGATIGNEDVREQLSVVEQLLSNATSDDEYMAAMLRNQELMFNVLSSDTTAYDTSNLPDGIAGLAVEPMDSQEPGLAVFDINGAKRIIQVTPSAEIDTNDVVFINGENNEVAPARSVDEGQLLGIGSNAGSREANAISQDTTGSPVTLGPGDSATLVEADLDAGGLWIETGTSAQDNTKYQYEVDGNEIFDEPLDTPLGLFNSVYRYPQPLKARSQIEVKALRLESASGVADYVSKIRYYE